MAQHDYVIDNQSFPATRSDLNSLFQAIASSNSGATAPSTTYANQIWYDTANNKLYIRNEDNDAWIALFELDQSGDVASTLATIIDVLDVSGTDTAGTDLTIRAGAGTGSGAGGNIILQTANAGSSGSSVNSHATAVTVDDAGDLLVGADTGDAFNAHAKLRVQKNDHAYLQIKSANTKQAGVLLGDTDDDFVGGMIYDNSTNHLQFNSGDAERVRVNSSGDLFVAKASQDVDTVGHELRADGVTVHTADGACPLFLNRQSSDGAITVFQQAGNTDGQINTKSGDLAIGTGDTAIRFNDGLNSWQPFNASTNAFINNTIILGSSGAKFNEIHCTNSTINTSDETEKQDIASLTDKEIKAATAISKLFKTYKYKDAVASKGDNARTHTGVIAQQVRTALEAEGLDVTKYSFWCSDTWWEHSVEVPAVEGVEAVTETQIDDDGNEVQVVVQEAVEALDAYTRIDDYYTADEAPEGSTQKTLLGIRYPELLAFVGAATEQRLTSIEARLTALEG